MTQSPSRPDRFCGSPGAGEEILARSGLDRFEQDALELMRLVFAKLSGSRPRHAASLDDIAGRLFGTDGPRLLERLNALVETMAVSRSDRFRYSNPYCDGCARIMTRDEAHLIRVVHCARRGQTGKAVAHALMLCDARPVEALIAVAQDLVDIAPLVEA